MTFAERVLALLQVAHEKATQRENVSSVTLVNAFAGSGSYTQAVASALLTTGGTHAPVVEICEILQVGVPLANVYLQAGKRVPGWGNSFIEGPDESLAEIFNEIQEKRPDISLNIDQVTELLHEGKRMVYPNIGCATAAVAVALEMPSVLAPHLFLSCRLPSWYQILLHQVMK